MKGKNQLDLQITEEDNAMKKGCVNSYSSGTDLHWVLNSKRNGL